VTCREFVEFLDRYLSGELSALERRRFTMHLSVCRDCVNYLDTFRETVALTEELAKGDEALPDDVPDGLVSAIMSSVSRDPE
jgi:predicted anti-sigma-YlaC factor YlaD